MKIKDVFQISKLVLVIMAVMSVSILYAANLLRPVSISLPNNDQFEFPKLFIPIKQLVHQNSVIVFNYQNKKSITKVGVKPKNLVRTTKKLHRPAYKSKKDKKRLDILKLTERFEVSVPKFNIEIRTDKKFLSYLLHFKGMSTPHKVIKLVADRKKRQLSKKLSNVVVQTVSNTQSSVVKKIGKGEDALVIYDYPKDKRKSESENSLTIQKDKGVLSSLKDKHKQTQLLDSIISEHHRYEADMEQSKKNLNIEQVSKQPLSPSVINSIKKIAHNKPVKDSRKKQENGFSVNNSVAYQPVKKERNPLTSQNPLMEKSLLGQSADGLSLNIEQKQLRVSVMSYPYSPLVERDNGYQSIDLDSQASGINEISFDRRNTLSYYSLTNSMSKSIHYPILTIEQIESLIGTEIDNQGILLIEHIDKERPFEIDGNYEYHISLDEHLKQSSTDIKYELFVGLTEGTRTIRYLDGKKNEIEVIATITDGGITHVRLNPTQTAEANLKVTMTRHSSQMNITADVGISYYNRSLNIYKQGSGVNFLLPRINKDSNDYLRLEYDNSVYYYVLRREQKNHSVELIDDYTIDELYDFMDINNPKDYCVVQYNLTNSIDNIHATIRSAHDVNSVNPVYFDNDGQFYDEPSANSKIAFILIDRSGTINLSTKYMNGDQKLFYTPCQPGSFFIQNL